MEWHTSLNSLVAIVLCLVWGISQDSINDIAWREIQEVAHTTTNETLEYEDVSLYAIFRKMNLADTLSVFLRHSIISCSKICLCYGISLLYSYIIRCTHLLRTDIDAVERSVPGILFLIEPQEQ